MEADVLSQTQRVGPSFLINEELVLLIFGGKGGVGKTTTAVASALHLAGVSASKRTLLLSTDPAHSLKDSLQGLRPPENMEIKEMEARATLEDFKKRQGALLSSIIKRGTILDDEDTTGILKLSMPGLDEVLGLVEAIDLIESGEYGRIILDTAPTGHTLRLLAYPEELRKWFKLMDAMMEKHRFMSRLYAGRYIRAGEDEFIEDYVSKLEGLNELLRDEERCEFVVVTIPETFAIQQTERLMSTLEDYEIPVKNIVVNQVHPPGTCKPCNSIALRHSRAVEEIAGRFPGCKVTPVPLWAEEVKGGVALRKFAEAMLGEQIPPFTPAIEEPPYFSMPMVAGAPPVLSRDLQFILFVGKGGVGKTTNACTTAVHMATRYPDRKYLLFSIDPAHSISDALNLPIGAGEHVLPNLLAEEIDSEREFGEFKKAYQEELDELFFGLTGGRAELTYDRPVLEEIMEFSPPGMEEVMTLRKVIKGIFQGSYATILLDAAPSGHLIRFLEMPEIVDEWLKVTFKIFLKYKGVFRLPRFKEALVELSKGLKDLRALLTNQTKTTLQVVAIPTLMALEETRDLLLALKRMNIPVGSILLNMVIPPSPCSFCSRMREGQERLIQEFSSLQPGKGISIIYRQPQEIKGLEALKRLGKAIYGG